MFDVQKPMLKMDLQLFAEGSDQSALETGGEPQQAVDGPPQPSIPNPLLADDDVSQQDAGAEQGEQQTVEELDFGGRKVPVVDPVIKELHNDWTELNRTYQQLNQKLIELQQQNQQYHQFLQLYQQQLLGQQQQPDQPQETPEERQRRNEELLERFYEDPYGVLNELVNQRVNQIIQTQILPQIEPLQRERQMQQQLQATMAKYPDFQNYVAQIQQIIQENPQIAELPNCFETAYLMAKGMTAQSVNPDDLLNDPEFQKKVLEREDLRNKIIQDHIQKIQQQKQSTVQPMGAQPGGQQPVVPDEKPKTLQEASAAVRKWLGIAQ